MSSAKEQLLDQLFVFGNLYEDFTSSQLMSFTILRRKYPQIPESQMQDIQKAFGGQIYLNRVKMVYGQMFSEKEIKEICTFWASETGRKLIKGDFARAIKAFHSKWAYEVEEACRKLAEDVL